MSVVFNPTVQVTVDLTAKLNETQLGAASLPKNSVGSRFVIQIDGTIPYGNLNVVVLEDQQSTAVYNLYDRWGNYVRTDRLYDIIRLRKHGRVPFSGCNPYRFQAVLATDPDRIIILNCLPHTGYTAPAPTPTPPASNAVFMPENQFGGSL